MYYTRAGHVYELIGGFSSQISACEKALSLDAIRELRRMQSNSNLMNNSLALHLP